MDYIDPDNVLIEASDEAPEYVDRDRVAAEALVEDVVITDYPRLSHLLAHGARRHPEVGEAERKIREDETSRTMLSGLGVICVALLAAVVAVDYDWYYGVAAFLAAVLAFLLAAGWAAGVDERTQRRIARLPERRALIAIYRAASGR